MTLSKHQQRILQLIGAGQLTLKEIKAQTEMEGRLLLNEMGGLIRNNILRLNGTYYERLVLNP